jgi:hypothetical protein
MLTDDRFEREKAHLDLDLIFGHEVSLAYPAGKAMERGSWVTFLRHRNARKLVKGAAF